MNKRLEPNKQPADQRKNNFDEVSFGFDDEQAHQEATRCLQCKNPLCVQGCPVNVKIPEFIQLIKDGKPQEADAKIKETNNLPAVCGRVCPQENQCEQKCILAKTPQGPINIGGLERYASNFKSSQEAAKAKDYSLPKVAVIGAGPSGLTCAADLAKQGYPVTVFETFHAAGGVLVYGIPEFRLPKEIVQEEVEYIKSLGVEIEYNTVVGATLSFQDLLDEGYQAIFIGVGAGTPRFLKIPGENLSGIFSANEYLTRVNLMKAHTFPENATPVKKGQQVTIIGGGNVAMDAARTALRAGSEKVTVLYRRSREEMPAREEEIENAVEEGVEFQYLTAPLEFLANENGVVNKVKCVRMELGAPDDSGRRSPVEVPYSDFELDTDMVIVAVGALANPLLTSKMSALKTNKRGYIEVDEKLMTSIPGVFAGGDIVTGAATVIKAMGAGKQAAQEIVNYLTSQK